MSSRIGNELIYSNSLISSLLTHLWQKNISFHLPNVNQLNLSVINSYMQEKHSVISSDEQLALGGMQHFFKGKDI